MVRHSLSFWIFFLSSYIFRTKGPAESSHGNRGCSNWSDLPLLGQGRVYEGLFVDSAGGVSKSGGAPKSWDKQAADPPWLAVTFIWGPADDKVRCQVLSAGPCTQVTRVAVDTSSLLAWVIVLSGGGARVVGGSEALNVYFYQYPTVLIASLARAGIPHLHQLVDMNVGRCVNIHQSVHLFCSCLSSIALQGFVYVCEDSGGKADDV